jgi:hypothetical protein
MQLVPGEIFAIVRQLADPGDTGTYYVQATIRNARTDVLLDTKNLTDRGDQRFSVEYQVPSKSSDAIYIAISTRVYTDSGYTTLSTVYGQEVETYLVEMRQQHFGGGGSSMSYKKIEEIVKAAIKEREKEPEVPADVQGIVDRAITAAVGEIKGYVEQTVESARTEVPPVDFSSITSAISVLSKSIEQMGVEIPVKVKSEIEAVYKSLEDAKNRIDEGKKIINETKSVQEETQNKILTEIKKINAPIIEKPIPSPYGVIRQLMNPQMKINKAQKRSPFADMSPIDAIREIMKKP